MSKIIQLYSDKDKKIKAYPKTLASQVYMDDGTTTIDSHLDNKANKDDVLKPILCFTFDDGLSADSITYNIFKNYNYPCSFGLITNELYNSNKNSLNNYNRYEKEGFEILSHSATHIDISSDKTDDILYREIETSYNTLNDLGFSCNGFIVPYSSISANNIEYAKKIYDYTLIGGTGLNGFNSFKRKTLTRISAFGLGVAGAKAKIDEAIATNSLLIFYDHGIDNNGSLTSAQLTELLEYVKNKIADNKIEIHTVKNAISKFYGTHIANNSKNYCEVNQITPIDNTSWVFENNTCNATKVIDSTFKAKTLRVTIPANSSVGTSVTLSNTITMPTTFDEIGNRLKLMLRVKMSNSQFAYFNSKIEISCYDKSNNLLQKISKNILPNATINEQYFAELFNDFVTININSIKISLTVTVNTVNTVDQFVYVNDVSLFFGKYYQPKQTNDIVFNTISGATPNVDNGNYFMVNNPSATTMTNLLTNSNFKEITLMFENGNTTIEGNNLIRLASSTNLVATIGSTLTLIRNTSFSSAWHEKSRSIR